MIRGVGPQNPNMRGEKLRGAFEALGFTNVRPVISSGNVVFETDAADAAKLEAAIEDALSRLLDFSRDTFVRSQAQLQALVKADPFAGLVHENAGKTYLTVTFFKSPPTYLPTLPHKPEGKEFSLHANIDGVLCCVVDLSGSKTTDLMAYLERHYGKQITTRTWKTIDRLLAKLA